MTDKDKSNNIFDMLDKAVEFYEQNKDMIEGAVPSSGNVSIGEDDPLKKAMVNDDKVIIIVDVGTDKLEDIRLSLNGTKAEIGIGNDSVMVDVPTDVNMDSASAQLNNGILEVEIPRQGGDE